MQRASLNMSEQINPKEYQVVLSFAKSDLKPQYQLKFNVVENTITPIWLKYLIATLKFNYLFKPRFMGFIDGARNPEFLARKLNECIDVINKDGRYSIPEKLEGPFTQEYSNIIHHHFELLIGTIWQQTEYWHQSSNEVKSAVCGLNDYVHELEAWERSELARAQDPKRTIAYVLTEFFESPGMMLGPEFEKEFSLDTQFGDMLLHYGQIGKTWLEVCIDKDADIFDPAIQPLVRLTGAFNINFFSVNGESLQKEADEHLKSLGKDPRASDLRLGQVCLAKLDKQGQSEQEIISALHQFQEIVKIEVLKDQQIVVSQQMPAKLERYFMTQK